MTLRLIPEPIPDPGERVASRCTNKGGPQMPDGTRVMCHLAYDHLERKIPHQAATMVGTPVEQWWTW